MVTGTEIASEINEVVVLKSVNTTDVIKRNHLPMPPVSALNADFPKTEFTLKFARLKKALRKRSSSIF